jgi:uncharacterized membrane protein YfcA
MDGASVLLLVLGLAVVALLYSSVGHAGGSGYIAVMSLAGMAPAEIRPTALALNVLVASIATLQFRRAGHFSWSLFWPFALLAVPMAFVGGAFELPTRAFRIVVGLVLLVSAANLLRRPRSDAATERPSRPTALAAGAGIGLFAGLTGIGGGIFLMPLLLLRRWAHAHTAAAVSAVFILMNSLAGLAGIASSTGTFPRVALPLAVAVVAGGVLGSWLGSRRLPAVVIRRVLAGVLVVAGANLLLTA